MNRRRALAGMGAAALLPSNAQLELRLSGPGAADIDALSKGANPAELPIEQPKNFELILHAGRAKAIGLTIPPAMLIRADRVIE